MHPPPPGSPATERFGLIIAQASQLDCQMVAATVQRHCHARVLACFATSGDVRRAVDELRPDLVLISANLQDGPYAGLKLASELYRSAVHPKTLLMLDSDEHDLVVESFRCGARGVFTRSESATQLRRCVTAVLNGQVWATHEQLTWIIDALAQSVKPIQGSSLGLRSLTKREEEVRQLVAAGLNNRQIAKRLNIHEHTVKNYVSGMFEKLGVSSRIELILHFHGEKTQASPADISTWSEDTEEFGT